LLICVLQKYNVNARLR